MKIYKKSYAEKIDNSIVNLDGLYKTIKNILLDVNTNSNIDIHKKNLLREKKILKKTKSTLIKDKKVILKQLALTNKIENAKNDVLESITKIIFNDMVDLSSESVEQLKYLVMNIDKLTYETLVLRYQYLKGIIRQYKI